MTNAELKNLLNQMTLREKIGQMTQLPAYYYQTSSDNLTGPLEEAHISEQDLYLAGSTLSFPDARSAITAQKNFLSKSRLGIPALFGGDVIHGFRTIFPIPLALGCTWNPELIKAMAKTAAREAAVAGIHINYSPMADLVRDPRWGRVMESTGEDPYLNGVLAAAFVKGYQGEDAAELKDDKYRVAATVKHFAAYGEPDGGRDYNTVDMSELKLKSTYLPAYKAAIDAGAKLVMTSFNTLFGVPATGNQYLLRKILREEVGFSGVVISDWGSVGELHSNGVAETDKDVAALAVKAGTDIEMATTTYLNYLEELVEAGVVSESLIDAAVWRILELKNDLGLFENPFRAADPDMEKKIVYSKEHLEQALDVARKSIVLLENKAAILPLTKDENLALLGPFAESNDLLGGWVIFGQREETATLKSVFSRSFTNLTTVAASAADCCPEKISPAYIKAAREAAEKVDKVILTLGEPSEYSGEAKSRTNIKIPEEQITLFKAIYEVNPNIIVVLFNGRPLDLSDISESKAIVEAWFPGSKAAEAIKEVLLGEYNPSGKLTMSFPRNVGQVPVYYNHFTTGRPDLGSENKDNYVSKYLDCENSPLYPFGYGLSYSEFSYSDLSLSKTRISADETLNARVKVKNVSSVDGTETVQLYIRDLYGEVVRPVLELKAFKQIHLAAGEEARVEFAIRESDLRYYHQDLSYRSDAGRFALLVGKNSEELLEQEFVLEK